MKDKYNDELEFEKDLIELLTTKKGWKSGVLKFQDEKQLIKNWANILYQNNRTIDRLGDYPLTDGEMNQIITQINQMRTPFNLNSFINGKVVTIVRDNQDDKEHFKKSVSLKIYDRDEIAAGQSVYQIAEQPRFTKKSQYLSDRRGDFMLLINGMPVIHIELKKSGVPISQAQNQIQKYSQEGLFSGIFSLIQVFVAMTPEEMTYFANPGPDGHFNNKYFFHWEDFNNEIINDWQKIADQFLSIPMAHQLIGFYTVADDTDGILKVMRSYQYYAANAISDTVSKVNKAGWDTKRTMRGGYIWHTTGSGKTMTSFKSAQLIANSKDADKVVFLMDRIELGTQSLNEYRGFADDYDDIQATESTDVLRNKLASNDKNEILIVTSIQKMSRLKVDDITMSADIEKIRKKRLVIIIDECHRSVFGEMLQSIQDTFPNALMFGFTGTPIHKENEKNDNTTTSIFGNELHRYSISDGIRDGNVLGFDTYRVETFSEHDVREAVALHQAKAKTVEEIFNNESKKKIYYHFMNDVPMASLSQNVRGIESYLPVTQYETEKHRKAVCEDILKNWQYVSINYKYHAILATSSIAEACEYYSLFKLMMNDSSKHYPKLKITCLFDPSTDNDGKDIDKETAIVEMLKDYEQNFKRSYSIANYSEFKRDVSNRLAHKKPYKNINHDIGETIDILIVVNQMLTGYDSHWVNALYLDKKIEYESIVQAFSRTNRLCDGDKKAGIIKYYRYPHTMELNIKEAFKIYSGDKPYGIFVDKLEDNIKKMNSLFDEISNLFKSNGIHNFEKNPDGLVDRNKFILLFNELCRTIDAAKVQGFRWQKLVYEFEDERGEKTSLELNFNKQIFEILRQRYKELFEIVINPTSSDIPPYDIDISIVSKSPEKINYDYMESNFTKYIKELQLSGPDSDVVVNVLNTLRQSFASLNQEDQKLANIIIHDIQSGNLIISEDTTMIDIINEYRSSKRDKAIHDFCQKWFIDENKFNRFVSEYTSLDEINEYGKLDKFIESVDITKVSEYLSDKYCKNVSPFKATRDLRKAIQSFMASGCLES